MGKKERAEKHVKFTPQRHRLAKRLRPNHRNVSSSQPQHRIVKGLFTLVPFAQQIMSGYQEEITRHNKKQKSQFEDTDQAREPESATLGMLDYQSRI